MDQTVLEARITRTLRGGDSWLLVTFCFLFRVLCGVGCELGEKSLICTVTICSLFSISSKKFTYKI